MLSIRSTFRRPEVAVTIAAIVIGWLLAGEAAANDRQHGTLKGTVVDRETKLPLAGANVVVLGTTLGDATDDAGIFLIEEVPVGGYVVQFSFIGYETVARTDVIVRTSRITVVDAELAATALPFEQIQVTAGYFTDDPQQPVSRTSYAHEEIRRAAGSAGDVSRIVNGLPAIAKVSDQFNSLIVRGGSPIENAFLVDNIQIPNINHYPTQGSTGGPIGLLYVDFIENVDFTAGGFPATYGDRLSSVTSITFREGDRDEFGGQLDLNLTGFGVVGEGPLAAERASWMLAVRRSYLDLLVDAIGIGVAPRFNDYQGKVVVDVSPDHRLTLLGVAGTDRFTIDRQQAIDGDVPGYSRIDIDEGTLGTNWRALWGRGYSNTALSYSTTRYDEEIYETASDALLLRNQSHEQIYTLRNTNHLHLSSSHAVEFGAEARYLVTDYDNFYAEYTDPLGNVTPETVIDVDDHSHKLGAFVTWIARPLPRLATSLGVRGDYFSFNARSHLAPRVSFSFALGPRTTVSGAAGVYYQTIPTILLLQSEANRELRDPVANHYVLGLTHMLTDNTRLTVEAYQKNYRDFPLDPTQPGLFLIDELFYRSGSFLNHEVMVDGGRALSRGVELTVQKKLAERIYGLMGGSYFRTRYRGHDEVWRDRVFDNRVVFTVEGGYKLSHNWEFSLRWIFAGGRPYTPFDPEASTILNVGIFDQDRINAERYPDYHSLNLRFDRRFHFSSSNLVIFGSVWNAYNRQNVTSYYWNQVDERQETWHQWGVLPVFGLEYEF